ncbi:35215_t:CDS:2, partial [Racocetra persica]
SSLKKSGTLATLNGSPAVVRGIGLKDTITGGTNEIITLGTEKVELNKNI